MAYTFYEDPGHGWLEVPMAELISLGIEEKISSCSYRDGDNAYLEEDGDMAMFVAAKMGRNPSDWRDAFAKLSDGDWFAFKDNMIWNDRATLRGAPEIWIRRLPSYYLTTSERKVAIG